MCHSRVAGSHVQTSRLQIWRHYLYRQLTSSSPLVAFSRSFGNFSGLLCPFSIGLQALGFSYSWYIQPLEDVKGHVGLSHLTGSRKPLEFKFQMYIYHVTEHYSLTEDLTWGLFKILCTHPLGLVVYSWRDDFSYCILKLIGSKHETSKDLCHKSPFGVSRIAWKSHPYHLATSEWNVKSERSVMAAKLTLTKRSDGIVEVPTTDQDLIDNL